MTREEAMWAMAPYIFDAGTPRERVAEDIAVRLAATVSNDGYFAQLAGIRAWSGTHDRLAGLAMPTLVIHGETDQLVPAGERPHRREGDPARPSRDDSERQPHLLHGSTRGVDRRAALVSRDGLR